jgi:hypothetical protein
MPSINVNLEFKNSEYKLKLYQLLISIFHRKKAAFKLRGRIEPEISSGEIYRIKKCIDD